MTKLPKLFKTKWVKALTSGKYEQGSSYLHENNKFCCLGISCVVAGVAIEHMAGWSLIPSEKDEFKAIPDLLVDNYTKNCDVPLQLAAMNDAGVPFEVIAGFIQENL